MTDLFAEARSSGQLDCETELGTIRLVEIISNKIFSITRLDQSLESLQVVLLLLAIIQLIFCLI